MVVNHTFIDSIKKVKECLPVDNSRPWKDWEIKHVMKHELHMGYKKISAISIHANSPKNLVLR